MKNNSIKIIWWESCITEHQIHTLSELSKLPNVELTVYSESLKDPIRLEQGWKECDWSLINIKTITSLKFLIQALRINKTSIHIFGGPFDNLRISFALFLSSLMNLKTFILTEPYLNLPTNFFYDDKNKIKPWILNKIRPVKYRLLWFLLRKKVSGVFAISKLAIEQLQEFGIKSNKIFPYGYFVPSKFIKKPSVNLENIKTSEQLRIIFVGTLNHRKGLDIAISAVNKLNIDGCKVLLDVFGPAKDTKAFEWSRSIKYKGLIAFGESELKISKYDMLILPSRYDGWGVVVNESIQAGVPVICTNQVGASSLIKKWGCGICYDSWDEDALCDILKTIHNDKDFKLNEFNKHNNKACNAILPLNAAKFMLKSVMLDSKNSFLYNEWYE